MSPGIPRRRGSGKPQAAAARTNRGTADALPDTPGICSPLPGMASGSGAAAPQNGRWPSKTRLPSPPCLRTRYTSGSPPPSAGGSGRRWCPWRQPSRRKPPGRRDGSQQHQHPARRPALPGAAPAAPAPQGEKPPAVPAAGRPAPAQAPPLSAHCDAGQADSPGSAAAAVPAPTGRTAPGGRWFFGTAAAKAAASESGRKKSTGSLS